MFSKLVRRTHMYLALFLTPWMAGYAASTLLMNHNAARPQTFITDGARPYDAAFEPGTPPRAMAQQILSDLNLEGAFSVQPPAPDGRLTISRQDLVSPRRVVYFPADHRVTIEHVEADPVGFLYRFHRRRGYDQPFASDRAMAVSVDLVVVATVFWALSGLWMWWEMRATRVWGTLSAMAGFGLFALFALLV